jgi:iron complex transport system ATP-binding protein
MFDPNKKLAAQALSAGYSADQIIENLDLTLPGGTITAVIGANGAGKSSVPSWC